MAALDEKHAYPEQYAASSDDERALSLAQADWTPEEERKAKEMRRRLRMRRGQPLGTVGVGEGDHFS